MGRVGNPPSQFSRLGTRVSSLLHCGCGLVGSEFPAFLCDYLSSVHVVCSLLVQVFSCKYMCGGYKQCVDVNSHSWRSSCGLSQSSFRDTLYMYLLCAMVSLSTLNRNRYTDKCTHTGYTVWVCLRILHCSCSTILAHAHTVLHTMCQCPHLFQFFFYIP